MLDGEKAGLDEPLRGSRAVHSGRGHNRGPDEISSPGPLPFPSAFAVRLENGHGRHGSSAREAAKVSNNIFKFPSCIFGISVLCFYQVR